MKDFKLIAIRPLENCNQKFLKVLTAGTPYIFYNQYDFSDYKDNNRVMHILEPMQPDFYSFKNKKNDDIKISISAIVGENGSGKSSIVELFYATCYNLSIYNKILRDEENNKRLLTLQDRIIDIYVEIFYKINEEIYLLKIQDKKVTLFEFNGDIFEKNNNLKFDLYKFFYTIAINYSLHSLNSKVLGIWVKKIFHKNDGYQTPIVLNPYRVEGNIDINNEEYLVKSRLISNVLGKIENNKKAEESLRNIIDRKIAYRLYVSLKRDKFKYKNDKPVFELTFKYGESILPIIYKHFLKKKDFIPQKTLLNNYAKEYILYKLISIASKYEPYKKLFQFFYEDKGDAEGYIFMLSKENSHVTFKLVQAINFLTNEFYFNRKESFDLTISHLSSKLDKESKLKGKELIDILPPAFFNVDIEFKDADMFSNLSSGEKQRIYCISSLLYHLNNLSSTNSEIVLYKYRYINVIFDELELYFHPELQRTLINDILVNIKKINLLNISAINILFITHSPFILSDISSNNILMLDKTGLPKKNGLNIQTFGANIFDLLKSRFFLENGPMGEFAKNIIKETIEWLNDEKRDLNLKNIHKNTIMMIGEPILQLKLSEMYDYVTKEKTEAAIIRKNIYELQKKLNKLSE